MYHRKGTLVPFIFLLTCINITKSEIQKKRDIINSVAAPANIPTRHIVTEYHNPVPIAIPQPVPILVPRPVPVGVHVGVPVDRPRPVPIVIPHPVAYSIPRPIAVPIDRPFPYPVPHPVPYTVTQGVRIPVPQPYAVGVPAPVAVRIPHHVQPFVASQPGVAYGYGNVNAVVENHGQAILHPY